MDSGEGAGVVGEVVSLVGVEKKNLYHRGHRGTRGKARWMLLGTVVALHTKAGSSLREE